MVQQTKANTVCWPLRQEERKVLHVPNVLAFGRLPDGLTSALSLSDHRWDMAYFSDIKATENNKELGGMLLLQRTHCTAENNKKQEIEFLKRKKQQTIKFL